MRHLSRPLTALVLAVTLASAASAQFCVHVPDSASDKGTCNAFPWGLTSTRYQTIVQAADFANRPTILREIAFAPCNSGTFTASRITIRFAYISSSTLSSTFAQNLGSSAVVVLQTQNFSYTYSSDQWSPIPLQVVFPYLPNRGNLVIDIEYVGGSGGSSFHRDTRQRVYANNWSGTPPATGSNSMAACKLRLSDGQACKPGAFTAYGSGCGPGPLTIAGMGTPQPNATVTVQMTKGAPSSAGAYFLGVQRLAIPLDAGGFTGCVLNTELLVVNGVGFDASGAATALPIPIPNDSGLVGVVLNFSGLDLDPKANPAGIAVANAVEMKIGL